MTEPPEKFLDVSELSVSQLIAREQARRRQEPEPKFLRPEWVAARRAVLEEAGYADEELDADLPDPEAPTDPSDWTVEQHADAIRRRP